MGHRERERVLVEALNMLIARDSELLDERAAEWSITHRLAVYLEPLLPGWNIDCEYDRQGYPAEASGLTAEPLYADSGEVLQVSLTAASDGARAVLLETLDGTRGPGGVQVTALASDGTWQAVGTVRPREGWSSEALLLPGTNKLRLGFAEAHALRFAGVLANASEPEPQVATLQGATSARLGDAKSAVASADDTTLAMIAGDTLSLAFADLTPPAGGVRTWFLGVTGTPVARAAASQMAARPMGAEDKPVAFALHQNWPDPTHGATLIPFDLPVRESVRLEVFDSQGRRVWRQDGSYEAGRYRLSWNLRSQRGTRVAPGVYEYRLIAGPFRGEHKLVVLP